MKKTLVVIFIFCSLVLTFSQEQKNGNGILILLDGREYSGDLVKIDDKTVIFKIDGVEKSFEKSTVSKINFQRKRMYENIDNISRIKDNEIQKIWEDSKKWNPGQENKVVILFDKQTFDFDAKNNVVIRIKKAAKILNEDGKEQSTQFFNYFRNNFQGTLLYGITILPDGRISTVEESAINDEPVNNSYPQYDILNRVKFGLKNADIGTVFVWEAEIKGKYEGLDKSFFIEKDLQTDYPIVNRSIEIKSPFEIKTFYSAGLIPYKKPVITKKKTGNLNIITFNEKDVKEYVNDEPNAPGYSIINPIFYASFNTGFEKMANQYYEKYFNHKPAENIKNLALKITTGENDEKAKIKTIYAYVNRQINLTSTSMNQSRFTPLDEKNITEYSALNILDKSYLFTRLLDSLGIKSNLYFYRSNSKSSLIKECPSLDQFDSLLCKVIIDKKPVFASFENQNLNIGQTFFTPGEAPALEISSKSGKIIDLKQISEDENISDSYYQCELQNDNSLLIKRTTKVSGAQEADWRVKRFLSKDDLDKWVKSRFRPLGNDFILESYKFINDLADFDKPVIFEEIIKVNNYSFSSGENLKLLKLPAFNFGAAGVSTSKRSYPFDFGSKGINIYKLSLKIPSGYKVDYLPKMVKEVYKSFSFEGNFSLLDNTINFEAKTIIKKRFVNIEEYKDLKSMIEERAKLSNEWIILSKK